MATRKAKSYNDITSQYNRILVSLGANRNLSREDYMKRVDKAQGIMSAYTTNLQKSKLGQASQQQRDDAFKEIARMNDTIHSTNAQRINDYERSMKLIADANKADSDFKKPRCPIQQEQASADNIYK